jgi:flagellar hook assembly protein FlgD
VGAGINIDYCSSIKLNNLIIKENYGNGGALYVKNSSMELFDIEIKNNDSKAIKVSSIIELYIDNLNIHSNIEHSGSFVNGNGANASTIQNVWYHNNSLISFYSSFQIGSFNNVTISDIIFEDNINEQGHGGLALSAISNSTISDIVIRNNAAIRNPGLSLTGVNSSIIRNLVIENNEAEEFSSGCSIGDCGNMAPLVIFNALIQGNNSSDISGAIYSENSSGVYLLNSTITNNISATGAAIVSSTAAQDIYLHNSIIYGNEPAQLQFNEHNRINTLNIDHCDVEGGEEGVIHYGNTQLNWLEGNIDELPQYNEIEPFPYSIIAESPCVDAGTLEFPIEFELPETDLAGNPRISGDGIDMGCYEYQYPNLSISDEVIESGDMMCYPNPFNPETTIFFNLAKESITNLRIYNIKGQLVNELLDEYLDKGQHSVIWNGTDSRNNSCASGIYFCRISVGSKTNMKKIMLVK